jgi:hypothetical protein
MVFKPIVAGLAERHNVYYATLDKRGGEWRMVRAKFKCTQKNITDEKTGEAFISLEPVYTGSEENEKFFQYTPGGLIFLF